MVTNTLLTPAEVGEILNLTPQTVRAMCDRGELDHVRIGTGKRTTYRIQRQFLDKLLQRGKTDSPESEANSSEDIDYRVNDDEYINNWSKE
jgi:excisionase family DNA binding protein